MSQSYYIDFGHELSLDAHGCANRVVVVTYGHAVSRETTEPEESRVAETTSDPSIASHTAITPATWRRAWNLLLDATRLSRYFSALSNRLLASNYMIMLFLALSASAAVISLIDALPFADYAKYLFNIATASLAFWMMIYDYSTKIMVARAAREQYQQIELDVRSFWSDLDTIDDPQGRKMINELEARIQRSASKPDEANIRFRNHLNVKCTKAAIAVIRGEYGEST